MRFYKRILSIIFAMLLCFGASGCNVFKPESPDPVPHFISPDQREEKAFIPMLEELGDDPQNYMLLTETESEAAQLKQMLDIVVIYRQIPIVNDDESVFETTRAVWAATSQLFLDYTNSAMSDFDRLHAFHDWLVFYVEYDFDSYNSYLSGGQVSADDHIFSLYGALVDKKAVCQGLSNAFSWLATLAGMDNVMVDGWLSDNGQQILHTWNKVQLDGTWYNVDITSDMVYFEHKGGVKKIFTHGYFLISDAAILDGGHKFADTNLKNPAAEQNYDVYGKLPLYSIGGQTYYAKIRSAKQLNELFAFIKAQDRQIGKVEVQLNFTTTSNFEDELLAAYNSINSDYKASEKPYVRMPNNAFLLLIYS